MIGKKFVITECGEKETDYIFREFVVLDRYLLYTKNLKAKTSYHYSYVIQADNKNVYVIDGDEFIDLLNFQYFVLVD